MMFRSRTKHYCVKFVAFQPDLSVHSALGALTRKTWKKCAERKLSSTPKTLRVINQQLWCCCNKAGIIVFDADLQQQRVIPRGRMGEVHDVAVLSNGDLVIATLYGLYHTDVIGRMAEDVIYIDVRIHYLVSADNYTFDVAQLLLCRRVLKQFMIQ